MYFIHLGVKKGDICPWARLKKVCSIGPFYLSWKNEFILRIFKRESLKILTFLKDVLFLREERGKK